MSQDASGPQTAATDALLAQLHAAGSAFFGTIAAQLGALTVHPALPAKTVREFIALAKSRPDQINYSSSGNGSAPHQIGRAHV